MRKILVARIDDRLIHGQVVTSWVKAYPITEILIIAEDLAQNMLMQRIYKSVAPAGIDVNILDNRDALNYLLSDCKVDQNLLILVKTPDVFEFLINNGVIITKIVLGGMGLKPGRETLIKNIAANDAERECLRRLLNKGIKIVYQMVPIAGEKDVEKVLVGK
ncbi:MAG: PTS sugar transporter subunit IIB [Chloroflexi bacterium]|jgi:PTS system mannose-specific IIB component|nr:PTS sugar transporter subunit IIB [Chloroflexota bacterium]